jgi:hypothetical protein
MSIRMHQGYWTIFDGDKAILACASFASAWSYVWELAEEKQHAATQTGQ